MQLPPGVRAARRAEAQRAERTSLPPLYSAERISKNLKGLVSPARLLELAEAGYMPCCRVDGSEPLFVLQEVKTYIAEHLLAKQPGIPFPAVMPVPVDRRSVERAPPPQLDRLKPIYWLSKNEYTPCVYFLVKNAVVVYVGQSVNVVARLQGHLDKDFDDVFWIPVPRSDLDRVEGAFIRFFKPKLNKQVSRFADPSPDENVLQEYLREKVAASDGIVSEP